MQRSPLPASHRKDEAASFARQFARRLQAQYGLDDVPSSASGSGASLGMARVHFDQPHLFVLPPLPAEDAFVVGVELSAAGSRRSFHGGSPAQLGALQLDTPPLGALEPGTLQPGTIHIADLSDPPMAYVCSPFHSVLFHMSRAAIDEFVAEARLSPVANLQCPPGAIDPVIAGLAQAVLPSLMRPAEGNALLLDHAALALYAHVAHAYGGARRPGAAERLGGLAPWQERRAKELLMSALARNVSLAEVARDCDLSRSHFGKAFKQTTGQTPHAWLTARRIDAVKQMLLASSDSLSDIALACGFADQSHLTRVFGERVGTSPARWRRARLN